MEIHGNLGIDVLGWSVWDCDRMKVDEYTKAMRICEAKFAESNWTPPKEFTPYRKLYDAILRGDVKEKPKLEKLLDSLKIVDSNWLENSVYAIEPECDWELDGCKITDQIAVSIPAIKFDERRWLSAAYVLRSTFTIIDKTPMDIFIQSLFIIPDADKLITDVCSIKGIHLDKEEIKRFTNTIEAIPNVKDQNIIITWQIDEDLDLDGIIAVNIERRELWNKLYQEMKYGLGL